MGVLELCELTIGEAIAVGSREIPQLLQEARNLPRALHGQEMISLWFLLKTSVSPPAYLPWVWQSGQVPLIYFLKISFSLKCSWIRVQTNHGRQLEVFSIPHSILQVEREYLVSMCLVKINLIKINLVKIILIIDQTKSPWIVLEMLGLRWELAATCFWGKIIHLKQTLKKYFHEKNSRNLQISMLQDFCWWRCEFQKLPHCVSCQGRAVDNGSEIC